MGQAFANRPRRLRLVVSLLIIVFIIAAYQAIFSFSQLRALSAPPAPKSGHPAENAAFRRLRQLDANGVIPPDGPTKATQQLQAMRAIGPAALAPSAWTAIGPGNIGGRIRSIVIHPTTPTTMWLGSVSGGVWKTTNGGASWQPLADYMANLSISSLLIDPNNANTLYAGTGESFANDHNQTGDGIFKTTNGGSTWAQIAATKCTNRGDISVRWCGINRLAISLDGQTILAATTKGIERGTAGGATWATQTLLNDTNVQDINFAPNDNTKAIASGEGAAWYSTTGGQSWQPATFTPAITLAVRIEVAYARSNPAIVYASIDTGQGELWKSVDGGQHYTKVTTQVVGGTGLLNGQGWYDNIIWVDPTNANILVVGGIDVSQQQRRRPVRSHWRTARGSAYDHRRSTLWDDQQNSVHRQ